MKRRLKMKGGPFALTWMRFRGIRLVKLNKNFGFCRIRTCQRKKRVALIVWLLF